MRFGWNATAYQLVNPGIDLWFSELGDAVVGSVTKNRVRVIAGAPVCAMERLAEVVNEYTDHSPRRTCYFGAAGRLWDLLRMQADYQSVVLGAQPIWNPQTWSPERIPSLRQQFNRARNKGVFVEEWTSEQATGHPDLRRVLQEWLTTRGLPPLHFLVEPETLAFLEDRRVFVAIRADRVVGFLVLSPIPMRKGWLTEQFIRGAGAPNGTVELLVDSAVRAVAKDGAEYVTLGLVPLSDFPTGSGSDPNPLWLRILAKWTRAHGRRFYNFVGLEAFKAKFRPDHWEPIYVVSHERKFSFRTLYAVAAAFTHIPPWLALLRGMVKALRQEIGWLFRGRR